MKFMTSLWVSSRCFIMTFMINVIIDTLKMCEHVPKLICCFDLF